MVARATDSGVISRRDVDLKARELRSRFAIQSADAFLAGNTTAQMVKLVENSPFKEHLADYPHENGLEAMAFTLRLTEVVVNQLCEDLHDPEQVAFTSARVAELGLNSIHDPRRPAADPHTFLAASKQSGYFFTPPEIARKMAAAAIPSTRRIKAILDPGAGIGSLLSSSLIRAKATGSTVETVYAMEIDSFTLRLATQVLERVRELLGIDCEIMPVNGDVVEILYQDLSNDGGRRYDCIVMNPPYGRAKFLRSFLTNAETRTGNGARNLDDIDKDWKQRQSARADRFRAISKELGLGSGAQDSHRIFLGLALSVLDNGGRLTVISPSSWLGDADSTGLRKQILQGRLLEEVQLYPEGAALFATVNQPTAVAVMSRPETERRSFGIRLMNNKADAATDSYEIDFESLEKLDPDRMRIPRIGRRLHEVYDTLQSFPKLKDLPEVKNARGEIDLTFLKHLITSEPTPIRLIRGDHIERYILRDADASERASYVDVAEYERAAKSMKKRADGLKPRLASRQVSYLSKGRRLSFAVVPAGAILANSCNYITVYEDSGKEIDTLFALSAIMNSIVIEWYFRIFNSNNHVANYEIDDFPVCLGDTKVVEALTVQGRYLENAYRFIPEGGKAALPIEDIADAIVAYAFGLSPAQISSIVDSIEPQRAARISGITQYLYDEGIPDFSATGQSWFNHVKPTLSDLDREIISYVPQGGNWQDIPESVPSQRLAQIREMTAWRGLVRTTYYGRLRPDQPAYTVATYYNRPGNGTNITPWEDRTLTSREAARLQSFPDWYVFLGNDGSIRKQIGNAVPPLLGYAAGQHLLDQSAGNLCVDLFAGAGGLSLGLELAGWNVVAALDSDGRAGATYKFNRPCQTTGLGPSNRTLFLQTDLTVKADRDEAMHQIEQQLDGRRLSLLAGGPPCQGFSHAGWRVEGDARNDLAAVFMLFVERLQPEVVVMENVEGLLTFNKGQVVSDLLKTLHDLGYQTATQPWILRAECFGTPQMRRRVFIVASKTTVIGPPSAQLQQCLGRRESEHQWTMFDELPYPVTSAEALWDLPPLGPRTHTGIGRRPLRQSYARWCRGSIAADSLITALSGEVGDS